MDATFAIHLKIDNPEVLRKAAEQKALDDGLTLENWRDLRKSQNDDLVMLLDPGSIPGCSVYESTAET